MSFDNTLERKAYLEASGKVVLNACPGSGKTTTIAQKLILLALGWEKIYGNSAGIACLSFTNVAKNEIAQKFHEVSDFPLSYPHSISTIDSFVNTNITLPFIHKIKNIGRRFRIVDDMTYIDRLFLTNGLFLKTHGNLPHKFTPSKIDYTINGNITWDGHDKNDDANFVKYGKAVKQIQWNAGLLKTSDSALFALWILKKHPQVSKYLSAKYPYLIIDEAQDTSEIQHAILNELIKGGLQNLDLVGDPYQCLYQWRDASPDLFLQKFDDLQNWNGLRLSENRRSTQKIVNVFSLLRRRGEHPITVLNINTTDLPLHILKYAPNAHSTIIPIYEKLCSDNVLTQNRILVRGNTMRNSLLGKHSKFEPWGSNLPYIIIEAKILLESNEIKEAVRKVKRLLIGLINPGFSFQDLKIKEDEATGDHQLHATIFQLIRELPKFDLSIKQWTIQTQTYLKDIMELTTIPDFDMRKRTSKTFDIKTLEHPVSRYFKKATTDNNLPVTTIHQVKGMTFDSVLLILSETSTGQNISLKDLAEPALMPTEKQRLIYVATSRPRKLLCLGIPDAFSDAQLKLKFGTDIVII